MKAQPKVIRASTEFSPVEGLKRDWESDTQDPMLPVENILIWIPPGDKYDIIYNLGWVGGFVCGGGGGGGFLNFRVDHKIFRVNGGESVDADRVHRRGETIEN